MLRKRPPRATVAPGAASDAAAASAVAVAALARRDYSAADLGRRLEAQGFESATVRQVLDELIERRYVDDERYAAHFASAHAGRGHGPLRIRRELQQAGVDDALIEAALEAAGDFAELARVARRRRFGPEPPASWPEQARQSRFLQYRGFSNDHIRLAVGPDAPTEDQ